MRPGLIATLLCGGALAAAGCGSETDDHRASASSQNGGPSAPEPALVEVPDVVRETAVDAESALEAAGFEPTFQPQPDDPSPCTVRRQDQTGEIEKGSEVILTLECMVEVPELSGEPADDAVAQLEDLGLTTRYEEKPDDPSLCTIKSQDVVGELQPESEVLLSVVCRLPDTTGKDLRTAISELERNGYSTDHPAVRDPSVCTVTRHATQAEPGATIALTVHCRYGHQSPPFQPGGAAPSTPQPDGELRR